MEHFNMDLTRQLLQLNEIKNELGETVFTTFNGWKQAAKKIQPDCWFDGDKDICNAFVGPRPYKRGESRSVGEWDGSQGVIFKPVTKDVREEEEKDVISDVRAKNKKIVQAQHNKLLAKGYKYIGSEGRSGPFDDHITTHKYLAGDGSHIHNMEYSSYSMGYTSGPNITTSKTKFDSKLHSDLKESVELHTDLGDEVLIELSEGAMTAVNRLLNEGKRNTLKAYKLPFRVLNGKKEVTDANDHHIVTCNNYLEATEVVRALNAAFKKKKTVKEDHEHLQKVANGDSSLKDRKTADKLDVGDVVEITGEVEFKGDTGEIIRFGQDKRFVVVNLYNHGNHSFHSSDVSEADLSHEEEHDEDEEDHDSDDKKDKFYVAFYDNDEERPWIGLVTREGGGKWHEKAYKGKPEYRWGQTYMSYLSANDIMSWIHKDYHRGIEIEGPFFDVKDAEEFVEHNWGNLTEGAKTPRGLQRKVLDREIKKRGLDVKEDGSMMSKLLAMRQTANLEAKPAEKVSHDANETLYELTPGKVKVSLTKNNKKFADLSHEDWSNLVAAHKNHVTGKFGDIKYERKGDGASLTLPNGEQHDISAHQFNAMIDTSHDKVTEEKKYDDFEVWKKAILLAYPEQAKKMRFKGRVEGQKATISAEVPGVDRSFGVWDVDAENGVILSEAKKMTPWEILDNIAKEKHGEFGYDTLDMGTGASLVDFAAADKFAEKQGEHGFWTMHCDDMKYLVNKNPQLLKGEAKKRYEAQK